MIILPHYVSSKQKAINRTNNFFLLKKVRRPYYVREIMQKQLPFAAKTFEKSCQSFFAIHLCINVVSCCVVVIPGLFSDTQFKSRSHTPTTATLCGNMWRMSISFVVCCVAPSLSPSFINTFQLCHIIYYWLPNWLDSSFPELRIINTAHHTGSPKSNKWQVSPWSICNHDINFIQKCFVCFLNQI